jgi:hypothetical protein
MYEMFLFLINTKFFVYLKTNSSTLNDALLYVDMDKSSNFIHANVPSHVLKVFPEEAHYAFFRSPFVLEQLSTKQLNDTVNKGGSAFGAVFRCEADPCAFLHIQGFDIKNIVSPPVNSGDLFYKLFSFHSIVLIFR